MVTALYGIFFYPGKLNFKRGHDKLIIQYPERLIMHISIEKLATPKLFRNNNCFLHKLIEVSSLLLWRRIIGAETVERARQEQVLLPASCRGSQAPQQRPRHRPMVKGVRRTSWNSFHSEYKRSLKISRFKAQYYSIIESDRIPICEWKELHFWPNGKVVKVAVENQSCFYKFRAIE